MKRGGSPDSGEDVILKSILMYYLRFRPSEPHQVHATVQIVECMVLYTVTAYIHAVYSV